MKTNKLCPVFDGKNVEEILTWADAKIVYDDEFIDNDGNVYHYPTEAAWYLFWKYGNIDFKVTLESQARIAAACFIYLCSNNIYFNIARELARSYVLSLSPDPETIRSRIYVNYPKDGLEITFLIVKNNLDVLTQAHEWRNWNRMESRGGFTTKSLAKRFNSLKEAFEFIKNNDFLVELHKDLWIYQVLDDKETETDVVVKTFPILEKE